MSLIREFAIKDACVDILDDLTDSPTMLEQLLNTMYPDNKHADILTSDPSSAEQIIDLITKDSKDVVIETIADIWEESRVLDRFVSAKLYLTVLKACQLVKQNKVIDNYILDIESDSKPLSQKGFYKFRGDTNEKHRMSYIRFCLNFYSNIYVHKDPFDAVGSLNKFFSTVSYKGQEFLLPSFGDTMMLLEQQLVVAFSLWKRFNPSKPIILPSSYVAQVNFLDKVYATTKGNTIYQVINNYNKDQMENFDYRLKGQIQFMINLFCGKYPSFDVMGQAFEGGLQACLTQGERERVLVFALVLLVNIGGPVLAVMEAFLRKRILSLSGDLVICTRRVRESLLALKAAKSQQQIGDILHRLVLARGDKALYTCEWNNSNDRQKNVWIGLKCKEIESISFLASSLYVPNIESVEPLPDDPDDGVGITKTEAQRIEAEHMLHHKSQEAKAEEENEESQANTSIQSLPTDTVTKMTVIDDEMCYICGIQLKNLQFYQTTNQADCEGEQQTDDYQQMIDMRKAHETSQEHNMELKAFEKCKEQVAKMERPLCNAQQYLGISDDQFQETEFAFVWKEHKKELERMFQYIDEELQRISGQRAWRMPDFHKILQNVEDLSDKAFQCGQIHHDLLSQTQQNEQNEHTIPVFPEPLDNVDDGDMAVFKEPKRKHRHRKNRNSQKK